MEVKYVYLLTMLDFLCRFPSARHTQICIIYNGAAKTNTYCINLADDKEIVGIRCRCYTYAEGTVIVMTYADGTVIVMTYADGTVIVGFSRGKL